MKFETLYDEQLASSTEMIRALLDGISQEEAQFQPTPETWSILEVICHLYDEEREDFREHLDFIIHSQNKEWPQINPRAWVAERRHNEQNFHEMHEKFFDERENSLGWLQSLSNIDWDKNYTSEFGKMPAGEMFASWIAHDNLHIRQLVELRQHRIENITKPYDIRYADDW